MRKERQPWGSTERKSFLPRNNQWTGVLSPKKGHFDSKKRNDLALMLGCLVALLASENL
jgi:hypothetical protein